MKRTGILLFVLMLASFTAGAENLRGDVDLDGRVSIVDVTAMIDYLLTSDASGISLVNADTDYDGKVSIADVTEVIDYLLTGTWGDDPVTPPDEHEWVDLGLPSGTLWATVNVGASSPEDYGDYFAWGETEPKEVYSWDSYKWYNGSDVTKYNDNSTYGIVDNKEELDSEDDAAYVNWGPLWRMPSRSQMFELDNLRYSGGWQWTTMNGVIGWLITGYNGNTLFLPAAGYIDGSSLKNAGSDGCYWSSAFFHDDVPYFAYYFGNHYLGYDYQILLRHYGHSVRAVREFQN